MPLYFEFMWPVHSPNGSLINEHEARVELDIKTDGTSARGRITLGEIECSVLSRGLNGEILWAGMKGAHDYDSILRWLLTDRGMRKEIEEIANDDLRDSWLPPYREPMMEAAE